MIEEQIATDDVVVEDNVSDAEQGLVEVVEETPEGDGVTDPVKTDAERKAEAKWAWKTRDAKRAKEAAERENAELKARINTPVEGKPEGPKYENFDSVEAFNTAVADYNEKLVDWKMAQREQLASVTNAQRQQYESLNALERTYVEKAEKIAEKYADYFEVEEKLKQNISPVMVEAIYKAENSAEIAYHVAKSPELHNRLLAGSAVDVALEIHKLDLKFKQGLATKKVSGAPEPITPLDGKGVGATKDPSKMSTAEWIKWDKEQTIRKLKLKQEKGML